MNKPLQTYQKDPEYCEAHAMAVIACIYAFENYNIYVYI